MLGQVEELLSIGYVCGRDTDYVSKIRALKHKTASIWKLVPYTGLEQFLSFLSKYQFLYHKTCSQWHQFVLDQS